MTTTTHTTVDQLLELPPDNMRHELIRGELTTMAPSNSEHGEAAFNIAGLLHAFLRNHDLGIGFGAETGFILARNPDTVRAPDCAFVRKERIPSGGVNRKFFSGAPDLAVEVLSPSDSAGEVIEKVDDWLDAGTRLVWVVDAKRKIVKVYSPSRPAKTFRINETLSGEDVLPGLVLPVAEIFR